MICFIELMLSSGGKIAINVDRIIYFTPDLTDKNRSVMVFGQDEDDYVRVTESYDEVAKKMRDIHGVFPES